MAGLLYILALTSLGCLWNHHCRMVFEFEIRFPRRHARGRADCFL